MVPLAPFRQLARRIAAQVDLSSELERLRAENQKLSNWEWRARGLEQRLADLEVLSRVVNEPKLAFITARVIADSSGAFARTVIISAGRNQNLKPGYPVINADGLVGRVVNTGSDSARVLLASDLNSRIPVAIGKRGVRAILAGDNGSSPRLLYVPPGADIAVGDDVATSGTGGLFPSGLRIGKVARDLAAPRVAMRANLDQLEYISVLFFDDPAQGLLGDLSGGAAKGRASNEEFGAAPRLRGGAP
jgi:rod shape-determining protein MreC